MDNNPRGPIENTDVMLANIMRELQVVKQDLVDVKTKQLSEQLQFPEEVIRNSGEVKPVRRMKRGLGAIPLRESEILEAQAKTHTAAEAARYLNVNWYTYRRYCNKYGIWKINSHYRKEGIIVDPNKGKYPLNQILEGKFPNYPIFRLKDKLVQANIKKPECEVCGYKERRITDNKIPLLLNFEDNNPRNHKLENIKLLCYNCTFCCGKGYIRKGKKYQVMDDPDRIQESNRFIPSRF